MFLLKNKISFIFLIVIAFIAIFSAKCLATSEFEFNGNTISYPDFSPILEEYPDYPNYLILYMHDRQCFQAYICNSNGTYVVDSSTNKMSIIGDDSYYYFCMIDKNTSSWYRSNGSPGSSFNYSFPLDYDKGYSIVDSSFDIYDTNANVVFQKASQPIVETQGTLAKIVEEQETEKVMEEIVGILPIVIVVIVSLIAIRKAIQWIRQTLKQQ